MLVTARTLIALIGGRLRVAGLLVLSQLVAARTVLVQEGQPGRRTGLRILVTTSLLLDAILFPSPRSLRTPPPLFPLLTLRGNGGLTNLWLPSKRRKTGRLARPGSPMGFYELFLSQCFEPGGASCPGASLCSPSRLRSVLGTSMPCPNLGTPRSRTAAPSL